MNEEVKRNLEKYRQEKERQLKEPEKYPATVQEVIRDDSELFQVLGEAIAELIARNDDGLEERIIL